ncbi:hypothetical protein ACFONI_04920 [Aeromonas media]|uniref:hypothetical protein n=1 Tax=Aeromonas media TaxID=651 RepID=UPI0002787B69
MNRPFTAVSLGADPRRQPLGLRMWLGITGVAVAGDELALWRVRRPNVLKR